MSKGKGGFLLAGVDGLGKVGYLFIPYAAIRSHDFYMLATAVGQHGIFFEDPNLSEFLDQPIRLVVDIPDLVLDGGMDVTITEVAFSLPRFPLSYDVRVSGVKDSIPLTSVVAGASAAPKELSGVDEGTILEVYRSYDEVDHRPWSLRHRGGIRESEEVPGQ